MNPNGLTHYSVMSSRNPGQRQLGTARDGSSGNYTPHGSATPRTQGIRRLESTRDVRHGSVVIERNEALLSMDPSKDPMRKVHEEGLYLNLTSRSNDTITVEWTYCPAQSWMPIDHFLLEHSSVTNPDFINVKLASNQRQYVLRSCTPGTNNFFVVSAIDVYGKVIQRSKQLTVQSSAPIDRPILKLKKSSPNVIAIEWSRPSEYGDGFISEYHLKVNGKFYTNSRSTKTSFDFIECRPMEEFTFRIQALSIKHDCNSEWSNVLEVACPASLPMTLERLRPKNINTIKVGWKLPTCIGGARVKEIKVYYKEASTYEMYNDQDTPDPDKIFGHRHAMVKTHKPDDTVSFVKVEPGKKYWAILRAEIVPEGCPPVITLPVRVRATIRPVPPEIKVTVYGELERAEANKEIAKLLDVQDKINRHKMLTQTSDIVKGAQLKNDEMQDMNVKLYQIETRLQELVRVVNKLTGFVPVVLSWEKPEFDEFSEPLSYRINVDDHSYQDPLPLETTQHSLKLDVEKAGHRISITTLSWHPVGHSDQSNVELVESTQFRPNRFFCYFTSHNKTASWPSKGGCRLEDFLANEKKLTSKHNVHRGLLKTRVAPKPFRVMGVHDATWQQLIRHFGAKKPTIILFWTKWCVSSQNMLQRFCVYAHRLKDKFQYLACCVKSGEDIHTHRKSIIELLNEKNLRILGNIRHCCGCHLAPDLPNNTIEKMENASIPSSFDLAGVPTFCILDIKGRLSWQGRVAADTDETFFSYMSHVMAQVEEQGCPSMECEHCKDENGTLHEPKQKHDEAQGDVTNQGYDVTGNDVINQGDDISNNDVINQGDDVSSNDVSNKSHDKFSLDEFHLLHSRLHGKALEEAERTQDEQYSKVGSLSPRKEWLERRRANAKKAEEEAEKQPERHRVRFGEMNPDPPQTASSQSASEKRPGIKNYQYRQPHRDYRSPHNGYEKSKHGYGASGGSTWRDKPLVPQSSVPSVSDHNPENGRKNSYKYTSVNYHLSERDGGDGDAEPDAVDSGTARNRSTALGYNTSGTGKWNSQIRANNVNRDMSRSTTLSSTQHNHQEEEIYEFMVPDNMRKRRSLGEKPAGKTTTKPEPYIYRRPSTLEPINDPARKSAKKDKYSHIQSRYSKGNYQPGKPKPQRYVISAHHKKGRRAQMNNTTQNGKRNGGDYNTYNRQAYM